MKCPECGGELYAEEALDLFYCLTDRCNFETTLATWKMVCRLERQNEKMREVLAGMVRMRELYHPTDWDIDTLIDEAAEALKIDPADRVEVE